MAGRSVTVLRASDIEHVAQLCDDTHATPMSGRRSASAVASMRQQRLERSQMHVKAMKKHTLTAQREMRLKKEAEEREAELVKLDEEHAKMVAEETEAQMARAMKLIEAQSARNRELREAVHGAEVVDGLSRQVEAKRRQLQRAQEENVRLGRQMDEEHQAFVAEERAQQEAKIGARQDLIQAQRQQIANKQRRLSAAAQQKKDEDAAILRGAEEARLAEEEAKRKRVLRRREDNAFYKVQAEERVARDRQRKIDRDEAVREILAHGEAADHLRQLQSEAEERVRADTVRRRELITHRLSSGMVKRERVIADREAAALAEADAKAAEQEQLEYIKRLTLLRDTERSRLLQKRRKAAEAERARAERDAYGAQVLEGVRIADEAEEADRRQRVECKRLADESNARMSERRRQKRDEEIAADEAYGAALRAATEAEDREFAQWAETAAEEARARGAHSAPILAAVGKAVKNRNALQAAKLNPENRRA